MLLLASDIFIQGLLSRDRYSQSKSSHHWASHFQCNYLHICDAWIHIILL